MVIDDDAAGMVRWQAGDEQAFAGLVEKYQRRVMAVAYRMLLNRAEAEDVAQETFLRLYRTKDRYRPTAKFSSFLFTIVHHLCLNVLRNRRHALSSLDEDLNAGEDARAPQWRDPRAVPATQVLEAQERSELVMQAIGRLSPEERMAVVLDHWEDLPFTAIAAVLHKSVPAVKSLLFRARAKLRDQLSAYIRA